MVWHGRLYGKFLSDPSRRSRELTPEYRQRRLPLPTAERLAESEASFPGMVESVPVFATAASGSVGRESSR